MTAPGTNSGPPIVRVEQQDPLVVSCADCGGATQLWGYEPIELLPWRVIEHWLAAHWDRAGLDEREDRP